MASEALHEFTDSNFETEVLGADVPVLVDFWAEWCQPCKMLTPTIEALAADYEGKAKIGKMNTDTSRDTAVKYGISSIPTVILFKNGEMVKKIVGLSPKEQFASAIDEVL